MRTSNTDYFPVYENEVSEEKVYKLLPHTETVSDKDNRTV